VCDFSCNAGYELVGEASSTCQADRTFTNVQPFCQSMLFSKMAHDVFSCLEHHNQKTVFYADSVFDISQPILSVSPEKRLPLVKKE